MAIALATMYRTLVAQRAVTAQRAAAPSIASTIAQKLIGTPAVLQYQPRPAVSVASTPALELHACGGRCGSLPSSSTPAPAGGQGATPGAQPALSVASALPAPATADSAKGKADPDPAAEETGGPSLLLWILIAVTIWWVVTRERGGRSLW